MGKLRGFYRKMKRNLRFRIMTLILVVFVPVSVSLITLSVTVLVRFAEQSEERALHELSLQMERLERDAAMVENYADEFTLRYLTEINDVGGLADPMTAYDMIGDLGRWYSHLELPGFVYLYDCGSGRTYVNYYGGALDVPERDRTKALVEKLAAEQEPMRFELRTVGGRDYICRTYVYRGCGIGFLTDAAECVYNALRESWDDRGSVYIRGARSVSALYGDGSAGSVSRDFDALTRDSIREESITWYSERTGLAVCIRYSRFNVMKTVPLIEWILLLLSLGCLALLPLIWKVLRIEMLEPVDRLTQALNRLRDGDEDYRINERSKRYSDEILMLFDSYDQSAGTRKRAHEREVQLVRTELDNLRLQVNPHMLLNSYNLIFALAQSKDYQRIQDYSYLLVKYFRYVLRKNDDFVPVSQEIEFIRNYVEIQSIRHPGAFHYTCKVQSPCERALIPPLLIENFVENSMKHALSPGKTVEILMDIKKEGDRMLIAVSDSGNGIAPEILDKLQKGEPYVDPAGNRHIGIWNSMRRVELFYGEKASFDIVSAPDQGTSMILKIPYREETP